MCGDDGFDVREKDIQGVDFGVSHIVMLAKWRESDPYALFAQFLATGVDNSERKLDPILDGATILVSPIVCRGLHLQKERLYGANMVTIGIWPHKLIKQILNSSDWSTWSANLI